MLMPGKMPGSLDCQALKPTGMAISWRTAAASDTFTFTADTTRPVMGVSSTDTNTGYFPGRTVRSMGLARLDPT